VIVATIAFGMGIDKSDVRFVAASRFAEKHRSLLSGNGRAGRDGKPSSAWMAYGLTDIVQHRPHDRGVPPARKGSSASRVPSWRRLSVWPKPRAADAPHLLGYFGETLSAAKCGNCDNCLSPPRLRDGKVIAQKLLSCAYRTGQRFGAMHLIDVLVGRMTERVKQFGHDKLSVFGVGRELNEKAVARRAPSARCHASSSTRQRGIWRVEADGDRARSVLKGETEVMLREQVPGSRIRASRAKSRRGDIAPQAAGQRETVNCNLLGALRTWRSAMARQRGVPAYVVAARRYDRGHRDGASDDISATCAASPA